MPIGLARTLFAVLSRWTTYVDSGLGSKVSALLPPPQRFNGAEDPLAGFGSSTEFHQCITTSV
jgi:hypothetical protein